MSIMHRCRWWAPRQRREARWCRTLAHSGPPRCCLASTRGIGRTGVDPSALSLLQTPALTAPERSTLPVAVEPAKPNILVIHETGPSAKLIAEIARSHEPTAYLGIGLPYGICGCGYFTSPTQLLNQAPGSVLQAGRPTAGNQVCRRPGLCPRRWRLRQFDQRSVAAAEFDPFDRLASARRRVKPAPER